MPMDCTLRTLLPAGDAIRHGILDVMRSNGIREGHRPVRGRSPPALNGLRS